MSRNFLFAAALLSSIVAWGPAAHAQVQCISPNSATPHGKPMWVGVLRFAKQSAGCGPNQFFPTANIANSLYRPYLTSGDSPSGISHFLGSNHAMLITNLSATAQFSGSGTYRVCTINGEVDFGGPISGNYTFTQTPAVVDNSTPTITLNGHIDSYGNVAGCSLYFQGVYVRDPQTLP